MVRWKDGKGGRMVRWKDDWITTKPQNPALIGREEKKKK